MADRIIVVVTELTDLISVTFGITGVNGVVMTDEGMRDWEVGRKWLRACLQ